MISGTTFYSKDDNEYSYEGSSSTTYASRRSTTSAITLTTILYEVGTYVDKISKDIKKLLKVSVNYLYNNELENLKYYNLRCRLLCGLYLPSPIIFRRTMFPRSGHLPYWIRKKRKDR